MLVLKVPFFPDFDVLNGLWNSGEKISRDVTKMKVTLKMTRFKSKEKYRGPTTISRKKWISSSR